MAITITRNSDNKTVIRTLADSVKTQSKKIEELETKVDNINNTLTEMIFEEEL